MAPGVAPGHSRRHAHMRLIDDVGGAAVLLVPLCAPQFHVTGTNSDASEVVVNPNIGSEYPYLGSHPR